MPKFRKKPVVIEAVQLTRQVTVHTLEGDVIGEVGDWLITGVDGEQYPCKLHIFEQTYEPVSENDPPVEKDVEDAGFPTLAERSENLVEED